MKQLLASLVISVMMISLFVGCTDRIGDFTIISTKNVDIGGKYKKIARHTGSDSKPDILLIPIGVPNLKQAVDNCIEAGNGELLTDAVLEFGYWTAIVYGQRTYTVTGDVWTKASTSDLLNGGVELFELQGGPRGLELVSLDDATRRVKVAYFASWL